MKLGDILKFIKDDKPRLEIVKIGFETYIILNCEDKNIIEHRLISKLFQSQIPLYWFKNKYEFELFFTYYQSLTSINFIIIG